MCVGYHPLSVLFVLYIAVALIYVISTSNGFDYFVVLIEFMSHFQLRLAYLFPPVVAYRALMFVEFKGSLYNIHLWNRKGAEIVLTGDEILEYVDSCLSSDV